MEQVIKEDILSVLERAIDILRTKEVPDYIAMSELSNHTIHDASIYQDEDSISIAVMIYALAKIVQRCCERGFGYPPFVPLLENAKRALGADDIEGFRNAIKAIMSIIATVDKRAKLFVQEVLDKARIKKGSALAEHGLSIAKTAEILGISQWELMSYIGRKFIDIPEGIGVRERYRFALSLFI
ncbi:MAG: hypothetical protein QXU88_02695 [Candidatus Woesearchaeota archaeon]